MYKQEFSSLDSIRGDLQSSVTLTEDQAKRFFKTRPGDYGEGERFIVIRVPDLRKIAKKYETLSLEALKDLIKSPFNEERLLSLIILVNQYGKADSLLQEQIHTFYMDHKVYVNNWNLVDTSAPALVGGYLWDKDRSMLLTLAASPNLWDRRIAIVATLYFIRKGDLAWTFQLAHLLLEDQEDLMHKAVGWMLMEAGKQEPLSYLKEFN